jgi:predicted DNA-binding ribbon-helix-helix protein
MCKLFIHADSQLWQSSTRSLRIDGMVTSIRLENSFWQILEDIAARDNLHVPQMITRLYHESIDAGHDLGNFTSFLRVCATRYISLQANGQIPTDPQIPLNNLDSDKILKHELALKQARH